MTLRSEAGTPRRSDDAGADGAESFPLTGRFRRKPEGDRLLPTGMELLDEHLTALATAAPGPSGTGG